MLLIVPMDSERRSAQVERLDMTYTGRRRRRFEDEKLKIVLESLQAPRQVAATVRRYSVSRSLLLRWPRSVRPEPKDATHQLGFVPANGNRRTKGVSGLTESAPRKRSERTSIRIPKLRRFLERLRS